MTSNLVRWTYAGAATFEPNRSDGGSAYSVVNETGKTTAARNPIGPGRLGLGRRV